MKQSVIVAQGDTAASFEAADPVSGWKILFAVGVGLTVIGLTDLAFLFVGANPSSLQWEFGSVLSFIQGQNALVIGVGAISAAAVASGWKVVRRVSVSFSFMLAALTAVAGLIFVLDLPAMARASDPAGKETLKFAGIRTCLFAVTYLALYLSLGVWTWRRRRKTS